MTASGNFHRSAEDLATVDVILNPDVPPCQGLRQGRAQELTNAEQQARWATGRQRGKLIISYNRWSPGFL